VFSEIAAAPLYLQQEGDERQDLSGSAGGTCYLAALSFFIVASMMRWDSPFRHLCPDPAPEVVNV